MEQRLIKTDVLVQIIKYLANRPYAEVASLISYLQQCPVSTDEPREKDSA